MNKKEIIGFIILIWCFLSIFIYYVYNIEKLKIEKTVQPYYIILNNKDTAWAKIDTTIVIDTLYYLKK
jgi:hypothetical protein